MKPFKLIIILLAIFIFPMPSMAGTLKDAENLINIGNNVALSDASKMLFEYTSNNPKDIKGHQLFARCLFLRGNDAEAKNELQRAVNYGGKDSIFQEEYTFHYNLADKNNQVKTAKRFLDYLVKEINAPIDAGKLYTVQGKKALQQNDLFLAEDCFRSALRFDNINKNEVGNGFLRLAALDHKTDEMKKIATPLVGIATINKIWSEPKLEAVFETTVDDSNINPATGNIEINYTCSVQKGDVFEIIATIEGQNNFNAKEVYIWKGENFNPQWNTSKNGKFKDRFEVNMQNGGQTIWIEKGKNIKAQVRVLRTITPKPNFDLILKEN